MCSNELSRGHVVPPYSARVAAAFTAFAALVFTASVYSRGRLQSHKPPPPPDARGGRRRSGGEGGVLGSLVGCCFLLLVLGAFAAALGFAFVYVPRHGGRWVQTSPGQYSLAWDAPPQPRSSLPSSQPTHARYPPQQYTEGRGRRKYDEL